MSKFKVGDVGVRRDGVAYRVVGIDPDDDRLPVVTEREGGGRHWYSGEGISCLNFPIYDLLPPTHNDMTGVRYGVAKRSFRARLRAAFTAFTGVAA